MSLKIRLATLQKKMDARAQHRSYSLAALSDAELDASIRRCIANYETIHGTVEPTPLPLVGRHMAAMREDTLSERETVALCKRGEMLGEAEEWRLYQEYLKTLTPTELVALHRQTLGD